MAIIKTLLEYVLWVFVSVLLGILYVGMLGEFYNIPIKSDNGLWDLVYMFLLWGMLHVGVLVGLCIALVFILFDLLYLRKRLTHTKTPIRNRFLVLLLLTFLAGAVHYTLEKLIDVI